MILMSMLRQGMKQARRSQIHRPAQLVVFSILLARATLLLVVISGLPAGAGEHALAQAKDASSYPDVDVHADDKIAIAVDPFDSSAKAAIFRVDYLKYGIMPMRIIITNNGDRPISLDDVRIHLMSAKNDKVPASEPEDVERKVATKDRVGSTIPIGPLKIHRGGKDADSKVEEDFKEFEYSALAVEPHTTRAGFLFYEVDGLGKDPLKGARMVFVKIRDADGKELFFFDVPLDKYLASR